MPAAFDREHRRYLAVEAAHQRRRMGSIGRDLDTEWFIASVSDKVDMTVKQRVTLATEFLKNKIVKNISVAVGKASSITTGRIMVTKRSVAGEFPRAETTQLMKTIFGVVRETSKGVWDGFVGTPLDYGLILETNMKLNRSFLRRTFNEEHSKINRILTGPITGGTVTGSGM